MNNIMKVAAAVFFAAVLAACGSGAKDKKGNLGDLKSKLEKLKKEKSTLDEDIRKIEQEITKADPEAAQQVKRLVAVDTLRVRDFAHYIDLQGKISNSGIGL